MVWIWIVIWDIYDLKFKVYFLYLIENYGVFEYLSIYEE